MSTDNVKKIEAALAADPALQAKVRAIATSGLYMTWDR